MKNKFEKWMKDVENKSENTSYQYVRSIDKISEHYSEITGENLDIYREIDLDLLKNISNEYGLDGKYSDFGNYGNGTIRNAIAAYIRFLEYAQTKQDAETNIHNLIYDINKNENKRDNWRKHIIEFHRAWIEQDRSFSLQSKGKYIWGEKVLVDPNKKITDVFNKDIEKTVVSFFTAKNKKFIREIEEEDIIQIAFLNNFDFIDFRRVINKLFIKKESVENNKTTEENIINLADESIKNINKELNTFKNILDYYESTIIQLNQDINSKNKTIKSQENIINHLDKKLKENEEALNELEYIKEKLEEIKSLLEKV